MTVRYGSFAYILSVLVPVALLAALFLLFRRRTEKTQKTVIFSIMLLNVAQHFLKSLLYPHLALSGFTAYSTAYNMCALLIILSPIAFLVKFRPLRDFIFLVGTFAGMIAIVVPYWSIGKPFSDPDFLRSLFCHTLLFCSSALMLLWGLHKPTKRSFLFLGIYFVLALGVITLNNTLAILAGLFPEINIDNTTLKDALYATNSVWMYGPPSSFSWAIDVAKVFLPDALVLTSDGRCVPVLWYAVPMYFVVSLVAYPICRGVIFWQRKNQQKEENLENKI